MRMLFVCMLLCRIMQLAGWLSDKGVGRVTATAVVTFLGGEVTGQSWGSLVTWRVVHLTCGEYPALFG